MNLSRLERGVPKWKQPEPSSTTSDWPHSNRCFYTEVKSGTSDEALLHVLYTNWSDLYAASGSVIRQRDICERQHTGGRPDYVLVTAMPLAPHRKTHETVAAEVPRIDTQELLSSIKDRLNLNITQLARVCMVQRPTIYEWFRGVAPRRSNLARLTALASIADNYDFSNFGMYKTLVEIEDEKSGTSIIELLSQENLDRNSILQRLNAIKPERDRIKKPSLSERLKAAGYSKLPSDEAETNLDSTSDVDLGPLPE